MKKSFTLAEVLITLGVIGIVAAMTLPSVFRDVRNKQLEARFKKSYSMLSSAIQLIIENEYGGVADIDSTKFREFGSLLQKYIGSSRKVGNVRWGGVDACNFMARSYKNFIGVAHTGCPFNDYAFYTSDASATVFIDIIGGEYITELYIAIDVNSLDHKPNRLGHDLFGFYLDKKGNLVPFGEADSFASEDKYCSSTNTSGNNGLGCTIRAITDKNYFKNLPK